MKSLLPKYLQDLFKKTEQGRDDESRQYSLVEYEFNLTLRELAKYQGRSEEEVLAELTQAGKEQLLTNREMRDRWYFLTSREQEVVALICMGLGNDRIAKILTITEGTVKSHLQNIFEKFSLRTRKEIMLALKDWDFEKWWDDQHR